MALVCDGGEHGNCTARPVWKVRVKGDRLERNWTRTCARHLNYTCEYFGERAELDVIRLGITRWS